MHKYIDDLIFSSTVTWLVLGLVMGFNAIMHVFKPPIYSKEKNKKYQTRSKESVSKIIFPTDNYFWPRINTEYDHILFREKKLI